MKIGMKVDIQYIDHELKISGILNFEVTLVTGIKYTVYNSVTTENNFYHQYHMSKMSLVLIVILQLLHSVMV